MLGLPSSFTPIPISPSTLLKTQSSLFNRFLYPFNPSYLTSNHPYSQTNPLHLRVVYSFVGPLLFHPFILPSSFTPIPTSPFTHLKTQSSLFNRILYPFNPSYLPSNHSYSQTDALHLRVVYSFVGPLFFHPFYCFNND